MGSAFANPVSRHTCVIVFFYHIPQSCESRIELKLSLGAQGWDSSFQAGLRRKNIKRADGCILYFWTASGQPDSYRIGAIPPKQKPLWPIAIQKR
jgi:hypothetical protein